jgi:hypothetical protein
MTPKYEFLGSDFSHTQTIVQEAVQVVLDVTCVSVGDTQREAKNDQRENSNGTNWQTRTNCSQNANELTQNTNDRREDSPHHSHFIIVSQKKNHHSSHHSSIMSLSYPDRRSLKVSRDRTARSRRSPQDSQDVLLFVRILFLYLKHGGERELLVDVKNVVRQCLHQNRRGDPEYVPLSLITLLKLQRAVGSHHWARTTHYYRRCRARSTTVGSG